VSDRPNRDNGSHFIDIIEDTVLPNTQLPDRLFMLPRGNQAGDDLSIAGMARGFISQLRLNSVEDSCPLTSTQSAQIRAHAFSVYDRKHLKVVAISLAG